MARRKRRVAARRSDKSSAEDSSALRRKRRSDEEMIHDLQEKIRQVKSRQQARELQKSPHVKAAVSALKSIDRALDVAAEYEETLLRHVLSDARKPLIGYLEERGFAVPRANLPRGRRPKSD